MSDVISTHRLRSMLRSETAANDLFASMTHAERHAYRRAHPRSCFAAAVHNNLTARDVHDLAVRHGIATPGRSARDQPQPWIDRVLHIHAQALRNPTRDLSNLIRDANRTLPEYRAPRKSPAP